MYFFPIFFFASHFSFLCLPSAYFLLWECAAPADILITDTNNQPHNLAPIPTPDILITPGSGALLVLSMQSNNLEVDGGKALAEGLKGNNLITELNIADNNLTYYGRDMSGIIILADAIKDMGALSKLSLNGNNLNAEGAKHIAGALKASKYVLAVILEPLSCRSDHYFHCWCLLTCFRLRGGGYLECIRARQQNK